MKTFQFSGGSDYDSLIKIHTSTANTDISLERKFQKPILYPTQIYGLLDNGKDIKSFSKRKWNDREYCVQYSKDVPH